MGKTINIPSETLAKMAADAVKEDYDELPRRGFTIEISSEERAVLREVLDRDRTARIVHGGLQGILSLNREQAHVLIEFLKRI